MYTVTGVAAELATALGKPLQAVTIPRPEWIDAMVGAGLPVLLAREFAELYDAEHRGPFHARGDRQRTWATRIDETLRHVVAAAAGRIPVT